jgi:hypothetical protein
MEAKPIRRYRVDKSWRSGILPAASGTRLHSLNFLDIDEGRPQPFERVRLVDVSSGKEVYQLAWDPRTLLTKPAISPSDRRLSRVRMFPSEIVLTPAIRPANASL